MYDFPTPRPDVFVRKRKKRESRVVSGEQESASRAQRDDLGINVILALRYFRVSNHLELVEISLFNNFAIFV